MNNVIRFLATKIQPNPDEIDFWVDIEANPYGGVIKYYNGFEWVSLVDNIAEAQLFKYYTKVEVNELLNGKVDIGSIAGEIDKDIQDLVKDVAFSSVNPNTTSMIVLKYDGSTEQIAIPVADQSQAGIVSSKDFLNFVKQHQLQELNSYFIEQLALIRSRYQPRLIAGNNITIDPETNIISARISTSEDGEIIINTDWSAITNKPTFATVATTGSYNDLGNKLQAGKNVTIDNNTINVEFDAADIQDALDTVIDTIGEVESKLDAEITRSTNTDATHTANIQAEVTRATNAENALSTRVSNNATALTTETNRAKKAEEANTKSISDEVTRAKAAEADLLSKVNANTESITDLNTELSTDINANTQAIAKEAQDRTTAITNAINAEVTNRNAAIKVETDRATAKENELNSKIDTSVNTLNASIANKADKSNTYTKAEVNNMLASVGAQVTGVYRVMGSIAFANLPTDAASGDVYNIIDTFILDGKSYGAGTNVVWTGTEWDPMAAAVEFDTTNLESVLSELRSDLDQEITDRQSGDSTLTTKVTANTNSINTINSEISSIETDITNLTGTITSNKTAVDEAIASIETELDTKLDASTYTTDKVTFALKTEIPTDYLTADDIIGKANTSDVYSKEEMNAIIGIVADGVYAVTADGVLVTEENATSDCSGVALIQGPHRFMILRDSVATLFTFDNSAKDISGITNYTYLDNEGSTFGNLGETLNSDYTSWTTGALSDFAGKTNSDAIFSELTSSGLSAYLSRYRIIVSDDDWSIPALGLLALISLNLTDINNMLSIIGGTIINTGYYWSSSECSATDAWQVGILETASFVGQSEKTNTSHVVLIKDLDVSQVHESIYALINSKADKTELMIDAPSDTKQYARQNGEWAEVQGLTSEQTTKVNTIVVDGDGTQYLSDDGTYKTVDTSTLDNRITEVESDVTALETTTNELVNYPKINLVAGDNVSFTYEHVDGDPAVELLTISATVPDVQTGPTIHTSTEDPTVSDGNNGDIWIKYTV